MKYKSRNAYLLSRYGITEEQYGQLLDEQKGCCAVCGRHANNFSIRLSVDHDHKTGEVRGLLCKYCNRYIVGRHRVDNGAMLLKAAYDYLNSPPRGWIVPPKKKKKRRKKRGKRRIRAKAS